MKIIKSDLYKIESYPYKEYYSKILIYDEKIYDIFCKFDDQFLDDRTKLKYQKLKNIKSNIRFNIFGDINIKEQFIFDINHFHKCKYNKKYICSIDEFYFNIWRYIKNGGIIGSSPIRIHKRYIKYNNLLFDYDFSSWEIGKYYNLGDNKLFVEFIDRMDNDRKSILGKFRKDIGLLNYESK